MLTSDLATLLFVPPGLAGLSVIYLFVKFLITRPARDVPNGKSSVTAAHGDGDPPKSLLHGSFSTLSETVQEFDGASIIFFRILRLLAIATLLAVQVFDVISKGGYMATYLQLVLFAYTFVLGIFTVSASKPRWRDVTSRQLALILFAEFLIYGFLDVWPYATQSPHPFNPASDPVTWIRVVLLALAAVVIPLIMPRPFRPLTPEAKPGANEVASLLSRVTYSFMDQIVFYAWRVSDIGVNDMPHLPQSESADVLSRRGMNKFDPLLLQKKRHVIWGFIDMWGYKYLITFAWMFLHTVSTFIRVAGMRNLLTYLETGFSPLDLQPWLWIILLGFGPFISACIYNQYLYVGTRISIENDILITQLVYHHSVRIRLKDDILDEKKGKGDKIDDNFGGTETAAAVTPSNTDIESVHSEEAESATSESTITSEPVPHHEEVREKTGAIVGKINNLVTMDLTNVNNSYQILEIPSLAVQIVISIVVLYKLLSWSALVGFGVMTLLTPVPTYVGRLMASVQKEKMKKTDKRVEAVTQSMSVLRMLKLFAWEAYMLAELAQRRSEELKQLRKGKLLEIAMNGVNTSLPLIAKITTFSIYTLVIKEDLSASRMFSSLMVFSMLEGHLQQIMYSIPRIIKTKVSYDRYSAFLNNTELLQNEKAKFDPSTLMPLADHNKDALGFSDCSFSWDPFAEPERSSRNTRKAFHLRIDGEILFQHGKINLIVGPTASGKTSVLMALLGEMYYKAHGVNSWYNLPRGGGVAYAAQESWVLNETIRENILFGEPYDEERYRMTLNHCALERDLSLWEAGDLTEVGEKGLTLSGGQKARVTLARALYSHAAIILLDDVLAALDVHTAKWVVDKALRGDLVKGRTVLLVTHNIGLAAPIASFVVLLGRHGTIAASGSVSDVLKKDSDLRAQLEKAREDVEEDIDVKAEEAGKGGDDLAKQTSGKLVIAEEKAIGRVELAAFMLYIKGIGGPLIWVAFISALIIAILINVGETWFVGFWTSQYESHSSTEVPVVKYLLIYAMVIVLSETSDCLALALWIFRTIRASRIIHSQLLESVFSATFRWLDVTPVGRIVARCTQDITSIDSWFEEFFYMAIRLTLKLIVLLASAVIMAGWYALVPGMLLAVLGGFLGLVYLKCQLCIRREMSNAKAPVISQIGTALSGLPSIRAYGAQDFFSSRLKTRIDTLSRASLTFFDIHRWIAVRIDTLSGIFASSVSLYLVYGGKFDAGAAGFTISVVLGFSSQLIWWVRLCNLLEIQANSLERILGFLRTDHEPQPTDKGLPPASWPSSGSLRVENLSARYSDDSPEVLNDISFEIASGERVGIVGRTGAGKSSVALALLRAIKTSGKVYYDGLATDEINLDALRSNITLIPQQPELIHGSLRTNLDPFGQHEDVELNDALRVAGLFDIRDTIAATKTANDEAQNGTGGENSEERGEGEAGSKIGLDTMVESGGSNFSLGQRQIIALARAIIRRSKLLILDEATAAIDYDTDAAIQKTLRTEFSKDTTFITIAHRLQTIMDYDRIMVLDNGKLVEFDTPKNLLEKEKGFLRALVDESEDKENLIELANKATTG